MNSQFSLVLGSQTFTVLNERNGEWMSYWVKPKEKRGGHRFVMAWRDDHSRKHKYLGVIRPNGKFELTEGSKFSRDSVQYETFKWLWEHRRHLPEHVVILESARCPGCGSWLADPTSIERGAGPVCFKNGWGSEPSVDIPL